MGLLRKRLQRRTMGAGGAGSTSTTTAGNRKGSALTKLTVILALYVVWAAHTVSKKPQLKTQLQERFQLLLTDKNLYAFVFPSKATASKKNQEVNTNNKDAEADADADVEIVEKNVNNNKDNDDEYDYDVEVADDNDENDHTSNDGDESSSPTTTKISFPRIPCGLIVVVSKEGEEDEDDKEVEVLPVSTCIGNANVNGIDNTRGVSLLNGRVFQRYPHLAKHKQVLVATDDHSNSVAPPLSILPEGTFSLRMGSVEATIEKSPTLLLFQSPKKADDSDNGNCDLNVVGSCDNENSNTEEDDVNADCDLILGKQFWDTHATEFQDDELYLSTIATTTATVIATVSKQEGDGGSAIDTSTETATATGTRVMVPYIRIRKPFP